MDLFHPWGRDADSVGYENLLLNNSSTDNQVVDQHNHGYYKNQVNEAAAHVERKPQEPKYEQNHKDSPKHVSLHLLLVTGATPWESARH
jgi:hypothetical protein